MKTELKNSGKEHQYLLDRLKRLEKHQKKIAPRAKVRTAPWQKNLFDRKAKNMKSVTHRIDYEPHREKEFEKTSTLLQRQADIELDPCTFNPNLNQKSLHMAQGKDYIIERDVPERYKRSVVEEKQRVLEEQRAEEEYAQLRIPDYSGRKPNDTFFNEKVSWKNDIAKRSEGKWRENYDKEVIGMQDRPTLTKNSREMANRRYNGEDFLTRVPKVIEDKKVLHKKLDTKYYNFSHKPTLYKPEKKTQSG
jgi:hypothetical protein